MNPRVLIMTASRHHATQEIGEAIAAGLLRRGIGAEARPIEEVSTLDGYDGAVVGSAIYMGRWLAEARRFTQIHASALTSMPVWLFSSGPLGTPSHPIPSGEAADVPVLLRLTRARGHRTFTGRLDSKQLNFAERTIARTIHAPAGDGRDWNAIDTFAGEIADAIHGLPVSGLVPSRSRHVG